MKRPIFPGRTNSDFQITYTRTGEEWAGEIEHLISSDIFEFNSLVDLIFIIHKLLENVGHPQTTTAMRSWSTSEGSGESCIRSDYRLKKAGSKAQHQARSGAPTFFVRIHFRQNATWQGSIQWIDGGGCRQFRSMLEMIMLMQEAVEMSGGSELTLASWEDEEDILS